MINLVELNATEEIEKARQKLENIHNSIEVDNKRKKSLSKKLLKKSKELNELRKKLRKVAGKAQEYEAKISTLDSDIEKLVFLSENKNRELNTGKSDLRTSLEALQRMSLRPATALIIRTGDINDLMRGGFLLRTLIPRIKLETERLGKQINQLNLLRNTMTDKKDKQRLIRKSLIIEQKKLSVLVATNKKILEKSNKKRKHIEKRIAILTSSAKSLNELIIRLNEIEELLPNHSTSRMYQSVNRENQLLDLNKTKISSAQGRLIRPVEGLIIQQFGIETSSGRKTRGLIWEIRKEAVIISPWEGKIVYSGNFRNFGRVLIINHGEGYHSLISGLKRSFVEIDQWELTGEPLGLAGVMVSEDSLEINQESESQLNKQLRTTLYVELLRHGQPINPLSWMATRDNRING